MSSLVTGGHRGSRGFESKFRQSRGPYSILEDMTDTQRPFEFGRPSLQ